MLCVVLFFPQGETEAVKCLIELGADVTAKDKEGRSFVHLAATAGQAELINTVISDAKFPSNLSLSRSLLLARPPISQMILTRRTATLFQRLSESLASSPNKMGSPLRSVLFF